jgi:LysM repeat protein
MIRLKKLLIENDSPVYPTAHQYNVLDQASAILRKEESIILTPIWDVNNWRIGYGSSTITKADGTVVTLSNNRAVKPTNSITKEDAERDLKRRLRDEFIPKTKRDIGSNYNKLNNSTLAALTSVTYNYGTIPSSVLTIAKTGNLKEIAKAVAKLSANPNRRKREADWILSSTLNTPPKKPATKPTQPATKSGLQGTLDYINQEFDKNNAAIAAKTTSTTLPTYHVVRSGDTLSGIATKYKTTVPNIKKINNLTTDSIKPGQKLKVK